MKRPVCCYFKTRGLIVRGSKWDKSRVHVKLTQFPTKSPPPSHLPPFQRKLHSSANSSLIPPSLPFDVEYIYGFVWLGVCKQSRWRHSVTEPSQVGGYVLLWQRYDNNKMVAMRYYGNVMTKKIITSSVYDCTVEDVEYIYNKLSIHIQQQKYSHRLNLL